MIRYQRIISEVVAGLVLITLAYCRGQSTGNRSSELKAARESLVVIKKEKEIISHQRDSIGKELIKANNHTTVTRVQYVKDTSNTRLKGDSVYDAVGRFIQVLDPRVSGRIKDTDAHVRSLEAELATAKFAIKIDTVYIAKVEQESKVNENIARMIKGAIIDHGIQAGVGYCQSLTGGTPCVYVGYGFSARF